MPLIRFTERMIGPADLVEDASTIVLPARGPDAGAELVDLVGDRFRGRTARRVLDLAELDVVVHGIDPVFDGFVCSITAGTVSGIDVTTPVSAGFCDLMGRIDAGRRMYYRLLVRTAGGSGWSVVEGTKELRGHLGDRWRETTTLAARVSVVSAADAAELDAMDRDDRAVRLERAFVDARPVMIGLLRVRGLGRQLGSMRGSLGRFAGGFARRAL